MGVEFLVCKNCEDTFPDCGDYTSCGCGERWCCDSCAESDGLQDEENGFTPKGSKWGQETSCNFCRGEDMEDWVLLNFALDLLGANREELIEDYKKKNE